MPGRLAGKTALVTGAAGAIGSAICAAFLREGAAVGLVDRDEARLVGTNAAIPAGPRAHSVCDVSVAEDVAKTVQDLRAALGPFNVLVNNAGISIYGGLEDLSEGDWDRTFAVNVKSAFLFSRELLADMKACGGGSVINMASESAFIGFTMHPAYCASKAALVHLSRSLAARYAPDRIRFNALCPGTIDTPLYRGFLAQQPDPDSVHEAIVRQHPLGLGSPEDVAHAAVFLASDESRYATGAPLLIDGGATAI